MNVNIQSFEASSSSNMPQAGKVSNNKTVDSLFASIMGQLETTDVNNEAEKVVDMTSLKGLVEELFQQLSVDEQEQVQQILEKLYEKMEQLGNNEESMYLLFANMILQPQAINELVGEIEQDDVQAKQLSDRLVPLFEKLSGEKESADIKKIMDMLMQKKEEGKLSYLQDVLNRVFMTKEGKESSTSILPVRSLPIYQPMEGINLETVSQGDVKSFALYVGMNGNKVNAQQFIRDFQNILMNSNLTSANGIQKLSIKLYPEHLGAVHVDIVKRGGEMIAKIIASSGTARDVLESQVQQLRAAFVNQNISVDKIEIASYLQQWKEHQQQESQSFSDDQQTNNKQEVDEDEENKLSFFEELTNLKA